jgi:hypothetical protein
MGSAADHLHRTEGRDPDLNGPTRDYLNQPGKTALDSRLELIARWLLLRRELTQYRGHLVMPAHQHPTSDVSRTPESAEQGRQGRI